jgi:hypothetical protein
MEATTSLLCPNLMSLDASLRNILGRGLAVTMLALVSGHVSAQERELELTISGEYTSPQVTIWSRATLHDGIVFVAPLREGGVQAFDGSGLLLWTALADDVSSNWNVSLEMVNDSLVVYDPTDGEAHYISASGELLSKSRIPDRASTYLRRPNGDVVFTANHRTPELIGYPVHEFTTDGRVRSFGYSTGGVGPGLSDPWDYEWKLVRGSGAMVWTHYRDRFEIEEWSDGERTGRRVSETPQWMKGASRGTQTEPQSWLHAAHLDGDVIWTIGHAVRPNWQRTLGDSWDGRRPTLTEQEEVWDSVVEVWTIDGGLRAFGVSSPKLLTGFAGPAKPFSIQPAPDGTNTLIVWQLAPHSLLPGGDS